VAQPSSWSRDSNSFQEQEFAKAIIEYKNAIQADSKHARGHYQLALSYLKTGQPRLAFS
jgi:Tfp pilus assembly protein PilF